jgi:hypothetical protein
VSCASPEEEIKTIYEATPRPRNGVIMECQSLPLEDLVLPILSYLDVKTLIEKKQVCRSWRDTCTEAIDAKQAATTRKAFSTFEELRQAVGKYCGYIEGTTFYSRCNPQEAEEFAKTYGYPINKWDVSKLNDSAVSFHLLRTFNDDISSWNVSNLSWDWMT